MSKDEIKEILLEDVNKKYEKYEVIEHLPFNEFAEGKSFDKVQVHSICPINGKHLIIFSGVFSWENNKLTSLDQDYYNEEMEVFAYKEYINEETGTKHGLNIIVANDW